MSAPVLNLRRLAVYLDARSWCVGLYFSQSQACPIAVILGPVIVRYFR